MHARRETSPRRPVRPVGPAAGRWRGPGRPACSARASTWAGCACCTRRARASTTERCRALNDFDAAGSDLPEKTAKILSRSRGSLPYY